MKIGMLALGVGVAARADEARELVTESERLGFASLWAPEHVVIFENYASAYPYSPDGSFPLGVKGPFLNPFIALSFAAACSTRLRLGTGICLVPEYNPVILGKIVASVEAMCPGRFALGVGIGWSAEEFAAVGVPWERRAQRTIECLKVMRSMWSDEFTTFKGEFIQVERVASYPKPVQGEKLPIIFGGESYHALRRVARHGTGWWGVNLDPEETRTKLEDLSAMLAVEGRKLSDVEILISPYTKPCTYDDLARYRDLGVNELVLMPFTYGRRWKGAGEMAAELAKEFVEPANKLG